MTSKFSKHFYVTGKVQGVWFRAGTQKTAEQLGLTGWVRNLPDGRVEVVACGLKAQIDLFETWLLHGPEQAQVVDLICEETAWKEYKDFSVL
jgi:acylphosphatase